jgi:hypothetical protein
MRIRGKKGSEMCSLGGKDLTPDKTPKKDREKEHEGGDEKIDTKKDDEKITTRKIGNSIFLTVTPGERHNSLAIRFSRFSAHDPYIY